MSCAGNVPEGGGEAKAEAKPAAEEPQQKDEPKGKPEPKPEPKKAEPASKPAPAPEKKPEPAKQPSPSPMVSSQLFKGLAGLKILPCGKNGIDTPYAVDSSLQCKRWLNSDYLFAPNNVSPMLNLLNVKRVPLEAQPKNII